LHRDVATARRQERPRARRVARRRHPRRPGSRGPQDTRSKAHWCPSPPRVVPTLVARPPTSRPLVRPRPLPAPARLPRPALSRRFNDLGTHASEARSRASPPRRLFKRPPSLPRRECTAAAPPRAAAVLHWGLLLSSAPRTTPPSSELTTHSLVPHVSSSACAHAAGAAPLAGAVAPVAAAAGCRRAPSPATSPPGPTSQIGPRVPQHHPAHIPGWPRRRTSPDFLHPRRPSP
jgi:hypothetical protein